MTMFKRGLLACAVAVLATGCSLTPQGARYADIPAVPVASDKATLVIFREYAGPLLSASTVLVNDREVVAQVNGDYSTLQVPPGVHVVRAKWPAAGTGHSSALRVTVRAGQVAYIELAYAPPGSTLTVLEQQRGRITAQSTALSTSLLEVPAAQGPARLNRCCAKRALMASNAL